MAGVFDGEGCATITLRDKYASSFGCRLEIEMCDKGPCLLFYKYFGGSLHHVRNGRGTWKSIYRWRVTGRKCIPIAHVLLPFLVNLRKRETVRCVMQFAEFLNPPCIHHISHNIVQIRQILYNKCRFLNRRGNHNYHKDSE